MNRSLKPGSFEDFVQWLGRARHDSEPDQPVPDPQVLSAAREAWQEHQSLQRAQHEALSDHVRAGAGLAEDGQPGQSFWSRVFAPLRDALVPHWQSVAITAAAVGVMSLGLLLLQSLTPTARVSAPAEATALHFETRHGEQQTYRLADNSLLHLNTESAVTVRYSPTHRLVLLTAGEANFEVTHEPRRTFRVLAGSAEVVDLGTKFDVRMRPDSTVVTVVEGRVAVGPSPMIGKGTTGPSDNNFPRSVQLGANQQIRLLKGEWPATPIAVDAQRATAWLHRQIVFDHETLELVTAEFNRYAPKPVEITTPALRDLIVGGVFSTDDPAEFLAFLRSLKGVTVDVTATEIRVSQK
jgi:ferric-dicitrate binding protein FerR (iron transport regulator)